MTLNTGIFDVSDPQNPDRVYSAALLCRMMAKQIRDGIVHGDGNEMAVTVTDPPAMSVQVGTGTAMVQGRFCENDAALTLSVPAAHATYPRIDRVVVRLNASPGRTIDIVVKAGTAAPEPAAPALTRTAETWELSLAQVRVEAGATSILSAKITDERGNASLCGVACPAYIPSSVLEIVQNVTMQGMPLVGLPTPTSSTGAATKHYVDSQITEKISGFGISDIAIDADKDWNGKNITNVGYITATRIRPEASDQVRYGPKPGSMTVTVPAVYAPGTAKITGNVKFRWVGETAYPGYMVIKVNSVTVATVTAPDTGNHTLTKIIQITGGDVINVTGATLDSSSLSLDDTAPILYPPAPTWPE